MAVSGLLALLDDVSSMLDDPSNIEQLAAEKTAKIAEDGITKDVTQRSRVDTRHEISVILAVARGALKNKLLFFIPTTFAVAVFAPWAVAPVSIASGAFIAYEGVKKFAERHDPAAAARHREALRAAHAGGKETLLRYEKEKIAQAIKTDAALSLELTGFQLGMVAGADVLTKLAVVGLASVGATMLLYTAIIGIIGMNGVARGMAAARGRNLFARGRRATGRQLMRLSSPVMKTIAAAGMTALFYVGGHLLAAYVPGAEHAIQRLAEAVTRSPLAGGLVEVGATLATGVAAGIATFGGARVAAGPLRRAREGVKSLWRDRLKAPAGRLADRFWDIGMKLCGCEPVIQLPPPPVAAAPEPEPAPAQLPETGATAQVFNWAALPGAQQPEEASSPLPKPPRAEPPGPRAG